MAGSVKSVIIKSINNDEPIDSNQYQTQNPLNNNIQENTKKPINNPSIYYQFSTSNKSFLEMHNFLKSIGIENNKFMLSLLNRNLAGVNPFDPNLDRNTKVAILAEVMNNFWYFIRECVIIPGPMNVPFELNRGNMAFLYLASMNINTILLMPRQTGKTIAAAVYYLYIYNFRANNSSIPLLNKEMRDSRLNLNRIREIRDLLPSFLKLDDLYSSIGKKKKAQSTVTTMENPNNHNVFRTFAKARNEYNAANLLRGQTFPLLWVDEFAFIKFMKTIYGNMIPAMNTAMNVAKMAGAPYGMLFTTTPGFLTTDEGKYAYQIIQNALKFHEGWYDLTYDQIIQLIDANKSSVFVHVQFSYEELGKSEKWLEDCIKRMNNDWPLIRREYLLEWSDEAENCPFTKEQLDGIKKFCAERPIKIIPIPVDKQFKYELNLYEPIKLKYNLIPKYPPIIGVDPSGGVSKDSSCITIIDSETTRVFADFKCNTISCTDLAKVIVYIMDKMMPNAIINIERNGGFGLSLIGALKTTKYKNRMYYEIKDRVEEESTDGIRITQRKRRVKVYGLSETHVMRDDILIELLKERVNLHKDKFISPVIYNELRGLEIKKNGKVEHSDLTHDDQIFSYLMALYVWYYGKNLRDLYGIDKKTIKTDEDIDDVIGINGNDENGSVEILSDEFTTFEKPGDQQVKTDINMMKEGIGITLKEFRDMENHKEEEQLRQLLRSEIGREAYSNAMKIPKDSIDQDSVGSTSTTSSLPNSLFTDFNKSDDMIDQDSIYNILDNLDSPQNDYDDESKH